MTKQELYKVVSHSLLFSSVSPETIRYALEHSSIITIEKHRSFTVDGGQLFVIIKGAVTVMGTAKNQPVTLNTLQEGQMFGMASLFGDTCTTTSMVATADCLCALLSQETVEELLTRDVMFTKNYITFLSDKIRFLNKKIAFFTSESTVRKVADYILSLPMDDHVVQLGMSLSKLASTLDMGRASLYRSLDFLEENGFIRRNRKVITMIAPDEFKKIYGES